LFDEKEKGEEQLFFRREEERQLKKLMEKMQNKEKKSQEELEAILGEHRVPDEVFKRLIEWKSHD